MPVSFDDFAHHKIAVDGLQLHCRSAGEGEAVVLLHGWPQHSLQWHAVAPALAERYRVIVPDLPGCGGSAIPPRSYGFDKRNIALSIRGMVEQLDAGPVRLVGYDHGAGVAYAYAAAAPDSVKQLVMAEYVLPGFGYERAMQPSPEWHTGSNWQLALFTVPDVAEFAFRGRERELLTWFLWHGSHNPSPVSRAHLDEYVDQISKPGALRAGIELYAAAWRDLENNQESAKTKLTMPVLGIGGRANAGEMVGRALAGVAENPEVAVLENAGHWLADENPASLTKVLLEFFGRDSGKA